MPQIKKIKSKIIDGRLLADKILHNVRKKIIEKKLAPSLAVILVGDDPASKIYVKLKQKAGEFCGIEFSLYRLSKNAPENEIMECLDFLNKDKSIHGIIVQLPLPKHLDENEIIKNINLQKDADGFHPDNLSPEALAKGDCPPLAQGIIKLIQETGKSFANKKTLIISNNKIFAEPITHIIKNDCSWSSPKDKNLIKKTQSSDIIIIAAGIPNFLKASMIKKDAIIIDVGCNLVKEKGLPCTETKRLVQGDVDFKSCSKKASWISPVPGGVGPITVAMLLSNVVKLCETQKS